MLALVITLLTTNHESYLVLAVVITLLTTNHKRYLVLVERTILLYVLILLFTNRTTTTSNINITHGMATKTTTTCTRSCLHAVLAPLPAIMRVQVRDASAPVARWHLLSQAMCDLDCESYTRGLLLRRGVGNGASSLTSP